ncbi:amidase [Rhodococcoides corynebacterioides]|uniref:amidase n=1 Tax=Rhodococcoides corynebacterioides TaxID=53972 RepID=A0ABS7NYL5_9NOCA|nr:amidase family protein [Rhodococcus corynebacterioides]MBY6348963.1 amidase [Rhodococcus corynebacterioides]MBY6365220.1 amidase [Rhodococcus corynebacterioides]MBY6406632.1 amidase [Rhodococcus corynebacterioides]
MTTMDDYRRMSATEIAKGIRRGRLRVIDVADAALARIDAVNANLNALIHVDREQILSDARVLDDEAAAQTFRGPLHGVPYTIKDLTEMEGLPFTMGFQPFADRLGTHDAAVARRMREAGGLFLGKTNTPEMGYYGGCDNNLFGPTHNPFAHGHTAGGSSGGASASVAAGVAPLAEGSDGAGSVRIPSSLCGTVGFKPTTGVIPQTLFPGRYNTWLFHGPITRTIDDNALMLDVLAGPDESDPLSLPKASAPYLQAADHDVTGMRIAWSRDLGTGQHVDAEVLRQCELVLAALSDAGAEVVEATPDWQPPSQAMWHSTWVPGFATAYDLFDWRTMHGRVDDNLIDIMAEAERTTAVDVGRAEAERGAMWNTWTQFLTKFDVLVSPTLTSAAFPLTQFAPDWLAGRTVREQILDWLLTYPYNMLGAPALTVPAGMTSDGKPVGFQIAGRHRAETTVLRVGRAVEKARPWIDSYSAID